jgi:hypothetical protein
MGAKDDFDLFKQISEMLDLDDDESENFVTSAMRRRGHKPRVDWDDNPDNGGGQVGDFFSGKAKRQQRQVGPNQRQPQQSGGSQGWQYGS